MKSKRQRSDLVEEERQERAIAAQIERAAAMLPSTSEPNPYPGPSQDSQPLAKSSEPLKFALQTGVGSSLKLNLDEKPAPRSAALGFDEGGEAEKSAKKGKVASGGSSALDELMREEEKAKERSNRKDYWLCEGIVVKVMSKALAEKGYYKQKGVVKRVIDKYVGEIQMLESKHVLRVDQEELETVIPQIGGAVRIVNGAYRGSNARLLAVNTERFCAKVQIEKGIYDGRVLQAVDYEDICKIS